MDNEVISFGTRVDEVAIVLNEAEMFFLRKRVGNYNTTAKVDPIMEYLAEIVQKAYIAGAEGTKGLGLNVPVEQRAIDYAKQKGFIP